MSELQEETLEKVIEVDEVKETKASSEENEDMETIIIDEEDVEFQDSDEEKEEEEVLKIDNESSKSKRDFVKEVKDLSEKEYEKVEKILECDDREPVKSKEQIKVVDLLSKFKDYISGEKFENKCDATSKKYNVSSKVIKNKFVSNALGTIADVLNLTVSIIGDVITGAAKFIDVIICSVMTYTTNTLHKIINILTFNCGSEI